MRFLRKIFFLFLAGVGAVTLFGCESTNDIRTAYFSNITAPSSTNNAVKVVLQRDKRVNEKYFDIQVRSNKETELNIWEEFGQPAKIVFEDTKWNSLTTLMVEGQDQAGTESFEKYKDVQSKTYIFTSETETELTFRVVVGEPEENASKTGSILTNTQDVSEEFKIKTRVKL